MLFSIVRRNRLLGADRHGNGVDALKPVMLCGCCSISKHAICNAARKGDLASVRQLVASDDVSSVALCPILAADVSCVNDLSRGTTTSTKHCLRSSANHARFLDLTRCLVIARR
jgi:hypothetical protein